MVTSLAAPRIGDLVVILNEVYEGRGRNLQTRCSARFLLPFVPLALIKVTVLDRGDELLRFAEVVGVIGFVPPGHRHHRAVVEIVIPERVDPITALLGRPDENRLLWLVFGDDDDRPPTSRLTGASRYCRQDVIVRRIVNVLRRVQSQAVEVEFLDPVSGV